jgi:hypothetical protein
MAAMLALVGLLPMASRRGRQRNAAAVRAGGRRGMVTALRRALGAAGRVQYVTPNALATPEEEDARIEDAL